MPAHQHSTAALRALENTGTLAARARKILDAARELKRPFSDREIMLKLGFSDMNTVRPRITELRAIGLLTDAGHTHDTLTDKQVRLTRLATPQEITAARQRWESETAPTQLTFFE